MTDTDGLHIENQWVAPASDIRTTYQGNDLTKPATLQSSYAQSFDLPDSLAVRKLTAHAEQLDSGSRWPYVPHPAMIIRKGEILFDGIAQLSSFSAGWSVDLYEEKRDLFARLDRSLRTLDLSRFNHPWTLEEANARSALTEGLFYPLVDYGLLKDGVIPPDTIFPAVFVKTIIDQLLSEQGYRLIGQLPDNELYKRLFIPFSESEPTNYDEQWQTDRYARVTRDAPSDMIDKGTLGKGYFLDRIQPFSLDNIDGFYQGVLHNYDTINYRYVPDTAMNLKVEAYQIFKTLAVTGSTEVILSIEVNSQKVASNRFESGAGYNILFLRTDKLSLSTTIKCKKGDQVQIRLEARRQTAIGAYRFEIFNDPDSAGVSFTPQLTTSQGDTWIVSRNLPDLTGTQLMIGLAYLYGGTWLVNKRRREIKFSALTDTVNNTANARDWSNKLNSGVEPSWVPLIEPYGQNNRLAWKEIDETKKAAIIGKNGITLNYGDGLISVDAPVLEPVVDLFEMPFAASTNSEETIPGYGPPVLIKTRSVSGRGDTLSITSQNTTVRLLLAATGQTFPVQSTRLKPDNETLEAVTVNLIPCWFGVRPDFIVSAVTRFTLSFSPIPLNRGEVCIIDNHYQGLIRVLRRMRVLTASFYLKPSDVAGIDFSLPVRLQRVQAGSLILSDGYYYLNQIQDYSDPAPCTVTLIAI